MNTFVTKLICSISNVVCILAVCCTVSGCVSQAAKQQQARAAAFQRELDNLEGLKKANCGSIKEIKKPGNAAKIANCQNDTELALLNRYGISVPAILLQRNAAAVAAADEYDRKKITKSELLVRLDTVHANTMAAVEQSQRQQRQDNLAMLQTAAQIDALQRLSAPPPPQPLQVHSAPIKSPVNCTSSRFGNTVNTNCY